MAGAFTFGAAAALVSATGPGAFGEAAASAPGSAGAGGGGGVGAAARLLGGGGGHDAGPFGCAVGATLVTAGPLDEAAGRLAVPAAGGSDGIGGAPGREAELAYALAGAPGAFEFALTIFFESSEAKSTCNGLILSR